MMNEARCMIKNPWFWTQIQLEREHITKYELLISLYNIFSSYIHKGKFQLLPYPYDLIAVLYFSEWHLNGRFWCTLPVNRSWRNLVKHFQEYPSAYMRNYGSSKLGKSLQNIKFHKIVSAFQFKNYFHNLENNWEVWNCGNDKFTRKNMGKKLQNAFE